MTHISSLEPGPYDFMMQATADDDSLVHPTVICGACLHYVNRLADVSTQTKDRVALPDISLPTFEPHRCPSCVNFLSRYQMDLCNHAIYDSCKRGRYIDITVDKLLTLIQPNILEKASDATLGRLAYCIGRSQSAAFYDRSRQISDAVKNQDTFMVRIDLLIILLKQNVEQWKEQF